jgi:hypothetical protein
MLLGDWFLPFTLNHRQLFTGKRKIEKKLTRTHTLPPGHPGQNTRTHPVPRQTHAHSTRPRTHTGEGERRAPAACLPAATPRRRPSWRQPLLDFSMVCTRLSAPPLAPMPHSKSKGTRGNNEKASLSPTSSCVITRRMAAVSPGGINRRLIIE